MHTTENTKKLVHLRENNCKHRIWVKGILGAPTHGVWRPWVEGGEDSRHLMRPISVEKAVEIHEQSFHVGQFFVCVGWRAGWENKGAARKQGKRDNGPRQVGGFRNE